jgi:hypothetical protein
VSVDATLGTSSELPGLPASIDPELPASVDATLGRSSSGLVSSSDVVVLGGSALPIVVSSDSSLPYLSEDNPDWQFFHDVPIQGLNDEDSDEEEYLDLPLPPKKTRKNYELTGKFQMEWSAKVPWSEMILSQEGLLHMVKCSICTTMRGRPIIMGPKWDMVRRHATRKCHLKNTELYATRRPTSVLQQIQGCNTLESRK